MTTQPEFEGERASDMENKTPSETASPLLTRHVVQGDPAQQTFRHGLFLLFIDIGNIDS